MPQWTRWAERKVASAVDRAFSRVALRRGGRTQAEGLGPEARIERLEPLAARYGDSTFADPTAFFGAPMLADVAQTYRRRVSRTHVTDLAWQSDYVPFNEGVAAQYVSHPANRTAVARWFQSGEERPVAILLHGYLGGHHRLEQHAWPIQWFAENRVDSVLMVQPFHGLRGADRPPSQPLFPNSDPRVTIEGFRQAIWDLRALITWFVQNGAPAVGVMGMSLGGYTTALLATVDDRLSFAVPYIPLASMADFADERGRLNGTPLQRKLQYDLLQRVYAPVSPLHRPCLVPAAGRMVIGAEVDRITPIQHAEKLADHFGAPLRTFYGGHLVQAGRKQAFSEIDDLLRGLGLFS